MVRACSGPLGVADHDDEVLEVRRIRDIRGRDLDSPRTEGFDIGLGERVRDEEPGEVVGLFFERGELRRPARRGSREFLSLGSAQALSLVSLPIILKLPVTDAAKP